LPDLFLFVVFVVDLFAWRNFLSGRRHVCVPAPRWIRL